MMNNTLIDLQRVRAFLDVISAALEQETGIDPASLAFLAEQALDTVDSIIEGINPEEHFNEQITETSETSETTG